MTRYVIGPDAALKLAVRKAVIPPGHFLLAPTLLRSQVLAQLFRDVQEGRLNRAAANAQLDYLRALRVRLLGDRVLQAVAWRAAEQLGWQDTFVTEYIALTKLQADALVVEDPVIAEAAQTMVRVADLGELLTLPP